MRLLTLFLFIGLSNLIIAQTRSEKRGISYGYFQEADLDVLSPGVSWWYNWAIQPEPSVLNVYGNYGFDFVPMAWNGAYNQTALRNYLDTHPDVKYILGFNEPNFISQANLTPSQAAAAWPQLESIADDYGLKIVSPAVNYCGTCVSENGVTYTDPVKYLDDFLDSCKGCRVDYIAIHCYMGNVGALSWYVGLFKKYHKPIWLTEFCDWENNPTLAAQKSYMIGAVDYLESDTSVFRYAWFIGRSDGVPYNALLQNTPPAGVLTDLGQIYVNMPVHDTALYRDVPCKIEAEDYTQMQGIMLEATQDVSGFANVGYIEAGDWLDYKINVPAAGNYKMYFRVASVASSQLELLSNLNSLGSLSIPSSGGYQNWQTYTKSINLEEGKQTLRLQANTSGFNINWIGIYNSDYTGMKAINGSIISVYPNPSKDKVFVNSGIPLKAIRVYDMLGNLVKESYSVKSIDISDLSKGMYIFTVVSNNNDIIKVDKLIKE